MYRSSNTDNRPRPTPQKKRDSADAPGTASNTTAGSLFAVPAWSRTYSTFTGAVPATRRLSNAEMDAVLTFSATRPNWLFRVPVHQPVPNPPAVQVRSQAHAQQVLLQRAPAQQTPTVQAPGMPGRRKATEADRALGVASRPGASGLRPRVVRSPEEIVRLRLVEAEEPEKIRTSVRELDISRARPFQFVEHLSQLHIKIYRPPRAVVYDKVYLFPLLLRHDHTLGGPHIALVVYHPSTGTSPGWKPPVTTYNAAEPDQSTNVATRPMMDTMQDVLADIVGLAPNQSLRMSVPPLHVPLFGHSRLPGQQRDGWMIAQLYAIMNADASWQPTINKEKVLGVRWFSEQMVEETQEIDSVTKELLFTAFKAYQDRVKMLAATGDPLRWVREEFDQHVNLFG